MKKITATRLKNYVEDNEMLPDYFRSIILLKIKDQKYSQFWLTYIYERLKSLEQFIQTK